MGTARTALFNWLYAKKEGGKFLLRIEDTDKERSKQEYVQNIFEGLNWLGISWDEDPVIQSRNINQHKNAIQKLLDKGLAYRCYATETELEEMRMSQKNQGQAPRYDNRHRNLSKKEESTFIEQERDSVIRFIINDDELIKWNDLIRGPMVWRGKDLGGDMVISRRAISNVIGDPLYNLVVVIDDSGMEITHVIRGEDHLANTAKQILLYKALELDIPKFAHTPLILNPEGKKLSKRDGVTSISDFKELGYTSQAMANYMTLLGWSPPDGIEERFEINTIFNLFGFERVNKAGAKFDWDKLNWLNAQVIHEMSPELLLESLIPLYKEKGWQIPNQKWAIELIKLISPSMTLLKDGIEQSQPFFEEPQIAEDGANQLKLEDANLFLKHLIPELEKINAIDFNNEKASYLINNLSKNLNIKKGIAMKTLRACLLGTLKGPDLITTWVLLSNIGKDRSRFRRFI